MSLLHCARASAAMLDVARSSTRRDPRLTIRRCPSVAAAMSAAAAVRRALAVAVAPVATATAQRGRRSWSQRGQLVPVGAARCRRLSRRRRGLGARFLRCGAVCRRRALAFFPGVRLLRLLLLCSLLCSIGVAQSAPLALPSSLLLQPLSRSGSWTELLRSSCGASLARASARVVILRFLRQLAPACLSSDARPGPSQQRFSSSRRCQGHLPTKHCGGVVERQCQSEQQQDQKVSCWCLVLLGSFLTFAANGFALLLAFVANGFALGNPRPAATGGFDLVGHWELWCVCVCVRRVLPHSLRGCSAVGAQADGVRAVRLCRATRRCGRCCVCESSFFFTCSVFTCSVFTSPTL